MGKEALSWEGSRRLGCEELSLASLVRWRPQAGSVWEWIDEQKQGLEFASLFSI